jgi:hypothetical protein
MEQIKNIGQVCHQHYEKLILSLVLLLLAGAVWVLYQASQSEKEKIRQIPIAFERKTGKPVPPVSLAHVESAMKQATNPPSLNFSGQHNLLNPVKWQQPRGGGAVVKVQTGKEVGAEAMQIVGINPIFLTIAFEKPAISGTPPDIVVTGYHTVVTNELATVARRRRLPQYAVVNATNLQVFTLTEVKGPPEAPTELLAQLKDYNGEKITFTPTKPYTRAVGYEADLKYSVTGKVYSKLRKDSPLDIDGEPYKVVDITLNKVVLSDDSNGKRYTIDQMAVP